MDEKTTSAEEIVVTTIKEEITETKTTVPVESEPSVNIGDETVPTGTSTDGMDTSE